MGLWYVVPGKDIILDFKSGCHIKTSFYLLSRTMYIPLLMFVTKAVQQCFPTCFTPRNPFMIVYMSRKKVKGSVV